MPLSARRFAPAALLLAACAWLAHAQQPPDVERAEVQQRQEQLAKQYRDFAAAVLRLAQRLELSEKKEERERAEVLKRAIARSQSENIDARFNKLAQLLGKDGVSTVEMQGAVGQNAELVAALRLVQGILNSKGDEERRREEIARNTRLLEEVKSLIRQTKTQRALTENQRADAPRLAKEQADLAKRTADLAKQMQGDSKPKSGDKGKDGKDGKEGKDKDGKDKDAKESDKNKVKSKEKDKDGKDSDGKDSQGGDPSKGSPKDGKDGKDAKGGHPKQGQPSEGDAQEAKPEAPGQKDVADAVPNQQQAAKELDKNKRDKAAKEQDEAIAKLTIAKESLEKKLKQDREEELEKLLANLEARINQMLALQTEVYDGTKAVQRAMAANTPPGATRAEVQWSQRLADTETRLVAEADKTLALMASEGSAVAFPQVLDETRKDMVAVRNRLNEARIDSETISIEEDILAALREMLAALKKAQQDQKDRQQQQQQDGGGGEPPPQALIDQLAELKMIRSLQMRVNERTIKYATKFQGEQAEDPLIRNELRDLSDRQEKVRGMMHDIATGKNK